MTDLGNDLCWWPIWETVNVGDNFEMLVTDSLDWKIHQHKEPYKFKTPSVKDRDIKSTNFLIVLAGRTETIDTQIKDEQKFNFLNRG